MKIQDKQAIMDSIRDTVPFIRKRNYQHYSIRCPICGDSAKNMNDSHCYIKFSDDESEPLLYKCFLCNSSGVVNKRFLDLLGVKKDFSNIINSDRKNILKSLKNDNIEIITGKIDMDSPQVKYIEKRLGKGLTEDDYNKFRIVANMNTLIPYISSEKIRNTLPSNRDSITLLTDDKSMMLTRLFDDEHVRWTKTKIRRTDNRPFYTISATLNLFTNDIITVNIAEGVIDVISAYKNFNKENSVFIAALGSDYIEALKYAILKGLIGTNVNVNIYIDSDQDEKKLSKSLKEYKWMFGNIFVCKNVKDKDIGVTLDKISLEVKKI